MSSPSTSLVSSTAESIDSASPIIQAGEPWLPEPGELPTTPWYEEKVSTLRLSDIPIVKDKGGTMGKFEVVIPHPDERAHRPPPGFHTFYMNQIEMGLRFPIPRFIAAFCRHISLSPSQLAPNSYSFLLALAVLLSYHGLPLIPYVLMQLVQIKRLGPGKFYLSHKGDHSFIKGNPSSHKGWMSRFFFVKCDVMRDPWKCEMHWRDSAVSITPRTPDRAPSLTPFLEAMHGKSYSAPELIREDLLCFYKFSRKGVELVVDLDEQMGKAELLRAMQEAAAAPPKKPTKRKAPSMGEKEARGEKRKKAGASTSGARTEEPPKPTHAPTPPTPSSEELLSCLLSPLRPEASPRVRGSSNLLLSTLPRTRRGLRGRRTSCCQSCLGMPPISQTMTSFYINGFENNSYPFPQAMAWGGEIIRRLTRAHRTGKTNRKKFDEAMGRHAEMVARLEELEVLRAQDEVVAATQRKELEAELVAEKEARAAEKQALRAELERAHARAERVKEDFLKSPKFDSLLAKKAWGYFKDGFWGCLAQFRSNGYSEEEHPASFLDLQQALESLGDDEDAEEEEQEEGEVGDGTEVNAPNSPKP
ncbi:hypothetical protein F511_03540 [Dorcoceras hygrometricum]|uniref:Transposase (Putative), gypsy type n=1 Tax=Dorcoceras hygrometricum TaxID=472368 RepID=A0A2Z7AHS2_9LAMI|nr:hypothetical protein F511_03540 [Dorcoceras hygrometricum]